MTRGVEVNEDRGWDTMVERIEIGALPVYTFERHNWALLPWSQLARQHPHLGLLSLDHHTDSLEPFGGHLKQRLNGGERFSAELNPAIQQELSNVDVQDDASVAEAVTKLRHDEHIQAALRLGVLDVAFVINFQISIDEPRSREQTEYLAQYEISAQLRRLKTGANRKPLPPRPFHYPCSPIGLYLVGSTCTPDCSKATHDDACERHQFDSAIDAPYLRQQLAIANEMATVGAKRGSCVQLPYVLDIDLDYFHTRKAVDPPDPSVFHDLIRCAVGITIARESGCVNNLALNGERLTSEWLLERVLDHVRRAVRSPA